MRDMKKKDTCVEGVVGKMMQIVKYDCYNSN